MKPKIKKKNFLIPSAIIALPLSLLIAGVIHVITTTNNIFKKDDSILKSNDVDDVNYLTLTNINDSSSDSSSTVKFDYYSAGEKGIYYRTKTYNETNYTNDWVTYENKPTITLTNYGDSIQFYGYNVKTMMETSNYFKLSGKLSASGDVGTLTNEVGGEDAQMDYLCYYDMFHNCDALYDISNLRLPSKKLAECCYAGMFRECDNITEIPDSFLPATELQTKCYLNMFRECKNLTTIPENLLPAEKMAEQSYAGMFDGCTSLTTVPENLLPATELAKNCYGICNVYDKEYYDGMFANCTNLKNAPSLPATTLAEACYENMFYGCNSLTVAPTLPAGKNNVGSLAKDCYKLMFHDCKSFTEAPELPATTLAEGCYQQMFDGCSGLATVPSLPATTLETSCYLAMFKDCTSIASIPSLPATVLKDSCYKQMFQGCTNISEIPSLENVTSIGTSSCESMFCGCSNIYLYSSEQTGTTVEWKIGSKNTSTGTSWNSNMFKSCGSGSSSRITINTGTTYYLKKLSPIEIDVTQQTFTFGDSSIAFSVKPKEGLPSTNFTVKYKVDNNWTDICPTNAGSYDVLVTRPIDTTYNSYSKLISSGLVINKVKVTKPSEVTKTYTYTGNSLKYFEEESTLYTYSNNTNTNAGNYKVGVSLNDKDNYEWADGTIEDLEFDWTINKADYDMSGITFSDDSKVYNGQEQGLEISGTLPTGKDGIQVTVSYSAGQTNVGEKTITATFATTSTNYNVPSSMNAKITITKATYDMSGVSWDYTNPYTYNGQAQSVNIDANTLPTGVSVKTYNDNSKTNAGNYSASVTEWNYDTTNYNAPEFSKTCAWKIDKANYDMSGVTFSDATKVYNGQEQGLVISGTLPTGADGIQVTVSYSEGLTEVGSKDITATFATTSTNYNVPSAITKKITITKAKASISTTEVNINQAYDGKVITPKGATSNFGTVSTSITKDGTSYTGDIKDVGTYIITYTVEGTSNYDGETKRFEVKITKGQAVITTSQEKIEKTYDKNKVTPQSASSNFGEVKTTITKDGESYSGDIVNVGTYTITYTVEGTSNYEGAKLEFEVKINKATYDMSSSSWNYNVQVPFLYDGQTKTVEVINLPEGVSVKTYDGNSASEIGTYSASVTEWNYDSTNYNCPSINSITWEIKAKPKAFITTVQTDITKTYDGIVVKPKDATSSEGTVYITVTNKDHEAFTGGDIVNAGTYIITYTVEDSETYEGATLSFTVTINKAPNIITIESGDDHKTYDGHKVDIRHASSTSGINPNVTIEKSSLSNEMTNEIKDAGDYLITYTVEESLNYLGANASYRYYVDQAVIDNQGDTQIGSEGYIVKDQQGNKIDSTVLYSKAGTDEWTSEIPTETGKYDVKIIINNNNLKAKTDFVANGYEVKSKLLSWLPYVIIAFSSISIIGILLYFLVYKKRKKKKQEEQ